MQTECWVYHAGTVPYRIAWEWQQKLGELIAQDLIPPVLLLLEHPHTYTIGRRGSEAHILWNQNELAKRQVSVHWVDRGGDVTYHGTGELVGYPLLSLAKLGWVLNPSATDVVNYDVISFISSLEQMLARTLNRLQVPAARREGLRGVWVPLQESGQFEWCKIASIGIKLTVHRVTQHGFALNVAPQMEYWQGIIPCGINNCRMISMADLIQPLPPQETILSVLLDEFAHTFQLSLIEISSLPFDTTAETHYTIP